MNRNKLTSSAPLRQTLTRQNLTRQNLTSRGFFDDLFGSDAGDTLNDARNLGSLRRSSSIRKSGTVGRRDPDFFKFEIDRNSPFTAELKNSDGSEEPIAITILDRRGRAVSDNGSFLFRNVEAGQTETLSISNLPRGEYYVRLQSANGDGERYEFELSRSSSGDGDGNGDGRDLGTLPRGRVFNGSGTVGGSDIDRYRFRVDRSSQIRTALFNNSNDPIAVSLLDSRNRVVQTANGRFLFANADPGSSVELFAPTLPSGSYQVRVQSEVGSQEAYRIEIGRSFFTPVV